MTLRRRVYTCLIVLTAVFIIGQLLRKALAGQEPLSSKIQSASRQRETVITSPDVAATSDSAFATAAAQNSKLRYELSWSFGGKEQRGWYLYVPLIRQLIGSEREADAPEFARSLAGWQKSVGLQPTGILDKETLSQMLATWQANRLKERGYPSSDQLLTLSPELFFDETRPEELRKVERQTFAAYQQMLKAALADPASGFQEIGNAGPAASGKYLKIISAFRSKEYQEQLRRQSPNAGSAGLAINSPHFTGRALDLYVGGEPVSTKDENRALQTQTRIYQWLVRNTGRFGFVPYFYEPWHWEYRSDLR